MDLSGIAKKLGLSESKHLIRKAAEFRRLCDVRFDSSIIGVGEVCKAIICLEISATRQSGMSEKAYNRSFNSLQNGLGVKNNLDVKELAIQFGCVRLIPFVKKGLSIFKERFLASLPASRHASADFTRPLFTAVAFYLCAKKHKLKVDKLKLIELCGASEPEFSNVSTSMKNLCHDVFGVAKEKKDARDVKGNRELLDMLPEKRKIEDGGYLSDDEPELSSYKKRKRMEKHAYEEWKSSVVASNNQNKAKVTCKRSKQTCLNFTKEVAETPKLEAL
ncbi:hypothetical protein I3760_05G137700 [Carya illinoinensis]|nr:hypothetical protein I3760_05G137700 [Carya illinoinensis]